MPQSIFVAIQIVAVAQLGLMAGFFFAFSLDVGPAMTHLDATTYITTQQHLNNAVRTISFAAVYFGAALLPFAVAAAAVGSGRRRVATGWLIVALAYSVGVFWITAARNVPINQEMATWRASEPPAQWQQARDDWNDSNRVRTVTAVLCFVGSLVLQSASARPRAH